MINCVRVLSDTVVYIKYEDGTGIEIHKGQKWHGEYEKDGMAYYHIPINDEAGFYSKILQELRRANFIKYIENTEGRRAQVVQEAQERMV